LDVLTLSIALAALIGAPVLRLFHPPSVRAQSGCSAHSLAAPYSYSVSGTYYDTAGDVFAYGDMGVFTPDGNGNLTGSDTLSNDGLIKRRTFTGTYTVNSDCTGSAKFTYSDNSSATVDLTLANAGKAINFIDTDNNVIVTGTAADGSGATSMASSVTWAT